MPVSFKVGTFQKSGTNTGFPFPITHITGLNFQPKALMLFGTGTGTSATSAFTNIMRPGMGWTAGSTQNFSVSWGSDDAVTTTNTFRRARNDYCLTLGASGSTAYAQMKLSAFETDGATFTYDNNDTSGWHVFYIAIGGSDITNVKAGQFNANTTTGTQDITDVGFQPDIVFFMGGNSPMPPAGGLSSTPHLSVFLGTAKSASEEHVMSIGSVDNVTTSDAARYQRTNRCIAFFTDGAVTIDGEAEYTTSLSNGFRINWLDAPANGHPISYLAIKGGTWSVGSLAQPTTAGSQSVTGLGYTPKGLMLYSDQVPANTAIVNHLKYAIGAADSSTSRWCVLGGDSDAVTTTESIRGHLNSAVMRTSAIEATPASATDINSIADFTSFDTNTGFTINWPTVNDAVARQILYVTVGDNLGASLVRNVTPETVQSSEATNRLKAMSRLPSATETVELSEAVNKLVTPFGQSLIRNVPAETEQLSEAVNRRLGKVKVLNEGSGGGGLGFTTSGFESSGFLTELEAPAAVQISEAINKLVTESTTDFLVASNLQLRFSGGASYNGNLDGGISSLGGALSSTEVTNNTIGSTWDDISFAQSASGITEYRCFYIYNAHATLTAYNMNIWVDITTPAGDSIEIAKGSAAMSSTEQTVGSEITAPTAVSFSSAPDEESAVNLGDIPPLGHRSIWLKRIVPVGTPSWNDNSYVLRVSFVSNHL